MLFLTLACASAQISSLYLQVPNRTEEGQAVVNTTAIFAEGRLAQPFWPDLMARNDCVKPEHFTLYRPSVNLSSPYALVVEGAGPVEVRGSLAYQNGSSADFGQNCSAPCRVELQDGCLE
jgi:hypothetical protein